MLLYLHEGLSRVLDRFVSLGRMSLTVYVSQATCFVSLFYGFGFGLCRKLGQAHSILVGFAFIVVQAALAKLWLSYLRYGPLEWLWRCGTNRTWRTPLRRASTVAVRAAAEGSG